MSQFVPVSVGVPGDVIDTTKLNAPFTGLGGASTSLNTDNYKYNSIVARSINGLAVVPVAGIQASRNTSSTPVTYTGNVTPLPITHGVSAMQIGPFIMPDDSFLRVFWHVHVYSGTFVTPNLNNFTTFYLYWDIGAGYVQVPNTPHWSLAYYNEDSAGLRDQTKTHNMAGSWAYDRPAGGGGITITGIRLYVVPATLDVLDSVDLGEDTLIGIVNTR